MAVKYRFDRSDVRKLRDALGATEVSLKDCGDLFFDVIADILVPSAEKTFDAEGRPAAWKSLSEAYALQKARKYGHTRILVASEKLVDSVAEEGGNEYSVREIGPRRLLFGTERPWAAVHQDNRPFLVVQDEDYDAILDLTTDWILKQGKYEDGGAWRE